MVLLETTKTVHPSTATEREHALVASRSGRRYCVLEVLSQGSGDREEDWRLECFEVSGWLRRQAAERRRQELEAAGRWLDEGSLMQMREGGVLQMRDLKWTS